MKTTIILTVVVVIVLVCLKVYHTPRQAPVVYAHLVAEHSFAIYHPDNLHIEPADDKFRYGSLQMYPIFASAFFITHHKHLGPYLSLHEALDQNKIVITELTDMGNEEEEPTATQQDVENDEAEVNRLFVENISSDTIIILGGEVVRGGNQDRMIAQDFMILPHSGKIDIAVYCVEHGRWAPSDDAIFFSVAMDVAPSKVRKASKAVTPQLKVWEEIATLNEDLEVHTPTEALASAVEDKEMTSSVEPYKKHLESIAWPSNVCGVIAVMGNEIVGLDIFAQPQLFTRYYPSLLSSYSSDAYAAEDGSMMPYADVQNFLTTLIANEAALDSLVFTKGTQLKHNGYRLHVTTYSDSAE
jgi:hypothetical protein